MRLEWGSCRRSLIAIGMVSLLTVLALELAFSSRRESQTWDEGCHIFAGYSYWTRADFGMNPEHPPLVKLLSTIPLLRLPLHVPIVQDRSFKTEANLDGAELLYKNNADSILFRTRMAAAVLTLFLAVLVFAAAREMFGIGPAFIALVLLAFEPNILAHGALVTTDIGVTCFLFATVYAFYRYTSRPSLVGLGIVGICAGLALASKHSGLLLFPILVLLALTEVIRARGAGADASGTAGISRGKQLTMLAVSLVAVVFLGLAVLWSFYGFRYAARPNGLKMNPPLSAFSAGLQRPSDLRMIRVLERRRLLPEAYLYGLVDVRNNADFSPSYIFGKLYRRGQWFYFPANLLIKSTVTVLLLLLCAPVVFALYSSNRWRELLFLSIPAAFYFLEAVHSALNRGIRHILPIYPFLIILAAAAGWTLIQRSRRWSYVVAALLLFHAASSLRSYPTYIAYANELCGGPANSHKYFTDSNVDWGQQLKATSEYLKDRGITQCWFASYVGEIVDTSYYGIPCKPLPTVAALFAGPKTDAIPVSIKGPVLVSASLMSGFEFGSGELNPYQEFQRLRPSTVIEHGIFVYEGSFEIPRVAALNHVARSWQLGDTQPQEALAEAQAAVALAPRLAMTNACLGDALWALGRREEARQAYQHALTSAQTLEPEYQNGWVPYLQSKL